MSLKKQLLLLLAGSCSAIAQEPVIFTDDFDYPNGATEGSASIPWTVKLEHSRMTGIDSGKLILNQGGKRTLLFAPVQTGSADVSVELDVAVKNKKSPTSPRFTLKASIDGQDWITLETVEGPFEKTIRQTFSTEDSFQLMVESKGNTYAQTATLDNLKVSINSLDTPSVSVSEPLWIENFEGLQYKATVDTGETAWEEFSESHSYSGIVRDRFHLAPRRSIATWESEAMDISGYSSVAVNAQLAYKKKVNAQLEASIDGGPWQSLWSDNIQSLSYTKYPTLATGGLSGDSLKLRFVADKWTTIQLYSVDVHGLTATEEETKPTPEAQTAQFSAIQNTQNIWHFDATSSGARTYTWSINGESVSSEAAFDYEVSADPTEITLSVTGESGQSSSISYTLNLHEVGETELVALESGMALSWPTHYLGFSQVEIGNGAGAFIPVGEPIPGTGLAAHFVSSLPYELRVSEDLRFGGFDYSGQVIDHLDMGSSQAANANFASVKGRLVYLDHSDLRNTNWSDAELSFAELHDADLSNARLIGTSLIDCVLDRANLSKANLTRADLTNSDLRDANLSGANLAYANLTNADLRGANMEGANLSGAILTNALLD